MMMETSNYSPPHAEASRPSLGFPLGTALLLIVIFSLSGIFSCCYHWDKLRRSFVNVNDDDQLPHSDIESSPSKPKPSHMDLKKDEKESLPVIMAGDRIAKFIALPCPCEPPRPDPNIIHVQVEKPPKPPPIAVPLY